MLQQQLSRIGRSVQHRFGEGGEAVDARLLRGRARPLNRTTKPTRSICDRPPLLLAMEPTLMLLLRGGSDPTISARRGCGKEEDTHDNVEFK